MVGVESSFSEKLLSSKQAFQKLDILFEQMTIYTCTTRNNFDSFQKQIVGYIISIRSKFYDN